MSTPLSTPIRQVKLGIASTKSLPLAHEYKKLLNEQHHRLTIKHQQDLDLIEDIRSYVKARLSIEREYTSALTKLGKQHSNIIAKKFSLLSQCDPPVKDTLIGDTHPTDADLEISDSRLQKRLANNGLDEPDKPSTLYKVWSEHINRLQVTAKNRADQFEQLIMVADKLKDIKAHKASIGKKCLDTHLKRIHEDILVSMVDVEKARKLYYEDESQAKKARENEEKIKRKRSGLLTKFTDLQAKKEKTSAQREANDIQSTQARNDYIMALAAANAHLQRYSQRDLADFINLIDDGVLDHCKIFMATLSECDINSLKDTLSHAQYWSKIINLTGSQKTNGIFLECEQSACLRSITELNFEPCNNDPIHNISLEHNADYALQHEIDKWFTWFKKECRNLSQLIHQLETCQRAFAEGKKSIELNGQNVEDLEPKIIELKQQIRKSEAAKLKAQARLKVIKEGGMHIEEWSAVESEIRADMARAQEELEAKRSKELTHNDSNESERRDISQTDDQAMFSDSTERVQLNVPKDSGNDVVRVESMHNISSPGIPSALSQHHQNDVSAYSAFTDPSLVWQDDYSGTWAGAKEGPNETYNGETQKTNPNTNQLESESNRYDLLGTSQHNSKNPGKQNTTSMTVQSSSPLSAIVDAGQTSPNPYQGMTSEAYKSDYECDYNRTGHHMRSAASSVEPRQYLHQNHNQVELVNEDREPINSQFPDSNEEYEINNEDNISQVSVSRLLNQMVIGMFSFDKTNEDDLAFGTNDVLRVIEISDENWVKARNEQSGLEGFIPTSYVKLLSEQPSFGKVNESREEEYSTTEQSYDFNKSASIVQQDTNRSVSHCKALYDYQPETDTYEDDGLPHLALTRGEVMRIIDQGEDDGWWLVEKEENGTRGYVPSMLVEEVEDDIEEDFDDGEVSEYDEDETAISVKAMPNFEPPTLQDIESESSTMPQLPNSEKNGCEQTVSDIPVQQNKSNLIPTSFIIIEPTPEVESRQIEKSTIPTEAAISSEGSKGEAADNRQVVCSNNSEPPADVSYSVINEDFVLEGLTRKPYQQSEKIPHHETPTILEEIVAEEESQVTVDEPSGEEIFNRDFELDVNDNQMTPFVVVESFEVERHDSSSSHGEESESEEQRMVEDEQCAIQGQKGIKHTGNVDVNPMLRLRAEEFSKQIIAEAISEVEPSTSSYNAY